MVKRKVRRAKKNQLQSKRNYAAVAAYLNNTLNQCRGNRAVSELTITCRGSLNDTVISQWQNMTQTTSHLTSNPSTSAAGPMPSVWWAIAKLCWWLSIACLVLLQIPLFNPYFAFHGTFRLYVWIAICVNLIFGVSLCYRHLRWRSFNFSTKTLVLFIVLVGLPLLTSLAVARFAHVRIGFGYSRADFEDARVFKQPAKQCGFYGLTRVTHRADYSIFYTHKEQGSLDPCGFLFKRTGGTKLTRENSGLNMENTVLFDLNDSYAEEYGGRWYVFYSKHNWE